MFLFEVHKMDVLKVLTSRTVDAEIGNSGRPVSGTEIVIGRCLFSRLPLYAHPHYLPQAARLVSQHLDLSCTTSNLSRTRYLCGQLFQHTVDQLVRLTAMEYPPCLPP